MAGYQYVRYDHRKHLEALFKMMMDPEEQTMFLTHSISNSLRDFDNWLQDRLKYHYHDFFVVESDKEELIGEISDLFYHVFVLMNNQGVSLEDIENKLKERHKITGNKKEFHTRGEY